MRINLSRKPQPGDLLVGPKETGRIREAVRPQGAAWLVIGNDGLEYIVRPTRYPKVWTVIGATR